VLTDDSPTEPSGDILKELDEGWPWPLDAVQEWFEDLYNSIYEWVYDRTREAIEAVLDMGSWFWDILETVVERVVGALTFAGGWLTDQIADGLEWLTTSFMGAWQTAFDWLEGIWQAVSTGVINIIGDIGGFLGGFFEGLWNGLTEWFNSLWKYIGGIGTYISEVADWAGEHFEALHSEIGELRLPDIGEILDPEGEWWQKIGELLLYPVREGIRFGLDLLLSTIAGDVRRDLPQLMATLEAGARESPELAELLSTIHANEGQLAGALGVQLGGGAMSMGLGQALNQAFAPVGFAMAKLLQNTILSPSEMVTAYRRGFYEYQPLLDALTWHGYDDPNARMMEQIYSRLLDLDDLQDLRLRGEISQDVLDRKLQEQGLRADDQVLLQKLYYYIPGVTDLVRMAVREVFTPEIVEAYGQMEDFPEDFAKWGAKRGLSLDWARNYWAAHWDLPSITQAFEMFHRTTFEPTDFSGEAIGQDGGQDYFPVISQERLEILLRTLDVMPVWRDKLLRIAYSPLTRVDVRRMYRIGALSEQGVYRRYLDNGFSPEDAAKMTEFTVKYETREEGGETALDREFSKSEILDGYRKRLLDAAYVEEQLAELGYDEDEIAFYINREEYKLQKQIIDAWTSVYHTLYATGIVERAAVTSKFGELGFPTAGLEQQFELWDIERLRRLKKPTKAELARFLEKGIIDENRYRAELDAMGYEAEVVDWYVLDRSTEEEAEVA